MKNKKTNYNYIFIFIIIIFIIIIFLSYYNDKNNKIPNIKIINMDIPDVKWPFINLKDENGKNINMLCIRGYLEHNADNTKQFLEYINISEEKYWDIIDRARPSHLWEKKNGKWFLKKAIWMQN